MISSLFVNNVDLVKKIDLEREKISREIRQTIDFASIGTLLTPEQELSATNLALIDNVITNIIKFTVPRDMHVDPFMMANSFAAIFLSRFQEMSEVSQLTPENLDS